jgi:probable HAF family extracellular repeat protein
VSACLFKSNARINVHAFLWSKSTGIQDLGTLGGKDSLAFGINDAGQVVGRSTPTANNYHAFRWSSSEGMRDLGLLGADNSVAFGINSAGDVAGGSYKLGGIVGHAFLWTDTSGMQDLGTLGGGQRQAQAINDSQQIVGFSYLPGDSTQHAFLWTAANGMQDLNDLIPSNSGWELTQATAINKLGQIVGYGSGGAFLLTPTNGALPRKKGE